MYLAEISQKLSFLGIDSIEYWNVIIKHKYEMLSKSSFENILDVAFINNQNYFQVMLPTLPAYMVKKGITISTKKENIIFQFLNNEANASQYDEIYNKIHLFSILSQKLKSKFIDDLKNYLNERFDSEIYYTSVMSEIIPYQLYFDEFVSSIPIESQDDWITIFSGADNEKLQHSKNNNRLNRFLDIAYKFDIDLRDDTYQKYYSKNNYYRWLFNLETFDYSLFNVYWLLYYTSPHFFRRMKKIPEIHKMIKESVLKGNIRGVTHIYFEYFVNEDIIS